MWMMLINLLNYAPFQNSPLLHYFFQRCHGCIRSLLLILSNKSPYLLRFDHGYVLYRQKNATFNLIHLRWGEPLIYWHERERLRSPEYQVMSFNIDFEVHRVCKVLEGTLRKGGKCSEINRHIAKTYILFHVLSSGFYPRLGQSGKSTTLVALVR